MTYYCQETRVRFIMNSFIKWVGGKRLLRNQILQEFPKEETECYVEVFGGAAWVLFAKEKHAKIEVYNDVNHNLVNLFRCVKYHTDAFYHELKWNLVSREQFDQAKEELNRSCLTDVQRAACFFVLIKCSFGAKMQDFSGKRVSFHNTIENLGCFRERLKATIIEQLDFEKLISLYDREGTLFYADPPYYKAEEYYTEEFQVSDHIRLKERLDKIQGKFVLTYNDCSFIRELYHDYRIISAEWQSNITAPTVKKKYQEVIIKNFD